MEITRHRQIDKGNLIAEFDLLLDSGMEIREMTHMRSANGEFVSFPSRKFENQKGETKYFNYVNIPDKDRYFKFQDACRDLLKSYRPATQTATPEDEIPF